MYLYGFRFLQVLQEMNFFERRLLRLQGDLLAFILPQSFISALLEKRLIFRFKRIRIL
jgi:hypothetical protein